MIALLCGAVQDAAGPAPAIVIGGGGDRPAIVGRFIELSGGPDARILVMPISTAQENPGVEMAAYIRAQGAKDVGIWLPPKDEIDSPASLEALRAARGLYFSGGDQTRGMALLRGTKALDVIREGHRTGRTAIAGSSAGAALMATVMIDGAPPGGPLSPGRFATSEGLGVTGTWITDQHFLQRARLQRLLNVLMDHPGHRGLGVDERTAAILTGDTIEVIGEGQVVLVEPPEGVSASRPAETRPLFRAREIRLRVLAPGDRVRVAPARDK
jgi:cyanophycinase